MPQSHRALLLILDLRLHYQKLETTSFSSVGSSSSNAGLVSAAASASNPDGSSAATFGNFSFGASSSCQEMELGPNSTSKVSSSEEDCPRPYKQTTSPFPN
ncbi:hypothetical protein T459_15310 [Capsicum annuum]|uniref:Uncharacterized protein n=1 Tax=Capsicum annuum TaxID=4072 RepID=A0A2G2ZK40_CAPAN|nr:hypothetical protein T459_15310 [Capsicum annuum]